MGRPPLVTEADIRCALKNVFDPHMNVSLVDMGMVRRIEVSPEGRVEVGLVFPCVGCPAWDLIQTDIKSKVGGLPGVTLTKVRIEWQHDWSREDIAPSARLIAREHGYCI